MAADFGRRQAGERGVGTRRRFTRRIRRHRAALDQRPHRLFVDVENTQREPTVDETLRHRRAHRTAADERDGAGHHCSQTFPVTDAVCPPSITSSVAFTNWDSSQARYSTA